MDIYSFMQNFPVLTLLILVLEKFFVALSVWVIRGFQACSSFYPENEKLVSEKIFVIH